MKELNNNQLLDINKKKYKQTSFKAKRKITNNKNKNRYSNTYTLYDFIQIKNVV